ncbi:MAG: acetoin utilization protein AcuC [Alphaproteobacteria bacterium]|nr:acetoin utilization protein AcuC [Alphaproteobacteria bacterium]
MLSEPHFIGSEIYRSTRLGAKHPLAIPRVSTTIDLARAMGWLPHRVYVESPRATPDQLARFHAPDYVAAVMRAEAEGRVAPEVAQRYNIGRGGNPVFGQVFSRPATACGGTLEAVRLLREGGIVHSPAGGTHHGRRDRASGFCYFNDPVLGILAFLDQGLERVYYVDVDAHHGDGVEDAFADDARVLTLSVHEARRWPGSGAVHDRAGGAARNLPVPAGFNDAEMAFLVERVIVPLGRAFRPQAVVLQCGADALFEDPLSKLELSNLALWHVVQSVMGLGPRLLVLGGGGYNPWAVTRCWAGVWATLNGLGIPAELGAAALGVLRSITWSRAAGANPPGHWLTTIADAPRPGPLRPEIEALAAEVLRDEPDPREPAAGARALRARAG